MLYTAYAQDMQEAYPQMTDDRIGHNGGPKLPRSPVALREPPKPWLPPDVPKPHFFKCDIEALRRAIFDKPLDIRGAFISALLAMYEFAEPLPADDNIARMRCGIMDMRVYRRVKREMVAMGLLFIAPSGAVSNERFELEIEKYVGEFKRRRDASKERENTPKVGNATRHKPAELSPSYAVAKPELSDSYGLAKPELIHDLSEKTNKINGHMSPNDPVRARVLELELELEKKKNPPTPQGGIPTPDIPKAKKGPSPLDALAAFESYNAVALRVGLQQAAKLTPDRQRKIIARLKDYGSDGWAVAMANLERSKFLTGQVAFKGQGDVFRANLDFVLQPTSFGKIHDGSYGLDRPVRAPASTKPRIVRESDKYEPGSQEWLIAVDREFAEDDLKRAAEKANQS